MNNFDAFRPVTRRHFWDNYRSPLTCTVIPSFSASASGNTIDIDVTPITRAAGPVLSGSAVGATADFSWAATPGAYAYVLYRATVEGGPFTILVAGLQGTSFIDTPPNSGTYYYRVTAIEPAFGETEVSNVVSITV